MPICNFRHSVQLTRVVLHVALLELVSCFSATSSKLLVATHGLELLGSFRHDVRFSRCRGQLGSGHFASCGDLTRRIRRVRGKALGDGCFWSFITKLCDLMSAQASTTKIIRLKPHRSSRDATGLWLLSPSSILYLVVKAMSHVQLPAVLLPQRSSKGQCNGNPRISL